VTPYLPYLRQALFGSHGLNGLILMPLNIVGNHLVDRNNTDADFERKISSIGGFAKVFPLLISNYNDSEILDP
jgi:hypothetical protein